MSEQLSAWDRRVGSTHLQDYAETYTDLFVMTRTDGILEIRGCTDGGPQRHSWGLHHAWGQLWSDIGRDPENDVVILTGTGDAWQTAAMGEIWHTPFSDWSHDSKLKMYEDALALQAGLIFNVPVPTIAAINGPGGHWELGLLCDITLCTPDTAFLEPHFTVGGPPGDGMFLVLQRLMGLKRASYHMYTGTPIDAATALDLGLVNEVLPREDLLPRAQELARLMTKRHRVTLRMTHNLVTQPWRRALVEDQASHMAHQQWVMGLPTDESPAEMARRYGLKVVGTDDVQAPGDTETSDLDH
jgi:enoyl-CoA hydratase/carnithine racemase